MQIKRYFDDTRWDTILYLKDRDTILKTALCTSSGDRINVHQTMTAIYDNRKKLHNAGKRFHYILACNFAKWKESFKLCSLSDFGTKFAKSNSQKSYHTSNASLYNLVK